MPRHLLIAFVLCCSAAFAQQTAPLPVGVARGASVEGIQEYRLANGLQVLLVPDDSKPTTTVNVTYHVGSRMENYGESGMAHLLEHLLFKGTPKNPEVWGEFSKRGLRANGTTSYDRTNYFASFSANDDTLRWYLGWQADAMVNSFIARKDLDTEMTVVRNEMERGENNPSRVLIQQMMASMYWWHNYGKATIGARADIENVNIERLQAFYRHYYQPDNATLIVAGRFDPTQTLAWVAEAFGPIAKPTRTLQPTYTLDPSQDGERSVTLRRVGGAPLVYVAHHAGAGFAGRLRGGRVAGLDPRRRAGRPPAQARGRAAARGIELRLRLVAGRAGADVPRPAARTGARRRQGARGAVGHARRAAQRADQQRGTRARARRVAEELGARFHRPRGDRRADLRTRSRAATGGCTSCSATRCASSRWPTCSAWPTNAWCATTARWACTCPPTSPLRAPAPARSDVAALVKDYKGDPAVTQAEAFDATPANLDARTQTFTLPSGMRVA